MILGCIRAILLQQGTVERIDRVLMFNSHLILPFFRFSKSIPVLLV